MTPVRITWHDSHDVGDGWLDPGALDSGPCVVVTVGYLLPHAKAGHLTVAQSLSDAGDVRHAFSIPVGMVVEIAAFGGPTALLPVEPKVPE